MAGVVCVIDCSKPADDPKQVSYRKLTRAEEAQRRRDHADAVVAARERGYLELRMTRDVLLRTTDHLEADRRWAVWRQKLRDLPATADPEKPRWPKPPGAVSCLYEFRMLWPRFDWTPLHKGPV